MSVLVYILIFVVGIAIGSFLNCLIYRLEKGNNFVNGRSICPKCKHKLSWYDLAPVLSFIVLRGKCRYCKKKISWQYPLVEIVTGLLFLLIFIFNFTTILLLVYFWIIFSALISIFVFDLKTYLIPDKIVYPAIILVFFRHLLIDYQSLPMFLLSGLGAAGFFFVIWALSKGKWMGFGDVQLGFLLGLFLGWPNVLVALFSGFLLGGIIGTVLLIAGKKKLKSPVPFGPFLVVGTFIALFWGERIINWYLNLL